ncbi:MAG TPA: penicillin-binding protein activator LpoB, partial [Treponemataceae bacterium]|nr:penicillin-binding protein activator LpoB [Treponemataceae bacterium]
MKTRILQRATFTFALAIAASGLAHAQAVPLDQAISQSARAIDEALPVGTRVAVVNCESPTVKMSAYVVGEITVALAKTKRLVLVEREDLDLVEAELDFQLSGAVSDESAQSIGKMLG